MAEDDSKAAVLTDGTPRDNGINLVGSCSQEEKNDNPSQKADEASRGKASTSPYER